MSQNNNNSKPYITTGRLQVANILHDFIESHVLEDAQLSSAEFWSGFEALLSEMVPRNKQLLAKRDALQAQLDKYCQTHKDSWDQENYTHFLYDIGYLEAAPEDFQIKTQGVDAEIAQMAGPQLVVPINNARYALNAANARWGSLYDALYGTDAIEQTGTLAPGKGYNAERGAVVIDKAKTWLDDVLPLEAGSHNEANRYHIASGKLVVSLASGTTTGLANPSQCQGYTGTEEQPDAVLLSHNGLHFELQIDKSHPIGASDPAGLKDILMEAALTTIMDCEDSVAAVDAEDKTQVYQHWLGLIRGDLSTPLVKNGKTVERRLAADRRYTSVSGDPLELSGRSLMFIRNVGHLMDSDAILLDGQPIYEGLLDAVITSAIAKQDLLGKGIYKNSREGSIYIVKPKMHGSAEVAFTNDLFDAVEDLLSLPRHTLKMGIMDEERRTSVNLKACIKAAENRAVFINTGFLDRTGDEIHTSMQLGPFAPKAELKAMPWISAYETANVATGLNCGLSGKAQIGKGMWPIPDQMSAMLAAKIGHVKAGANTAWVPSPTAATLHAMHYHQVDVFATQQELDPGFDGLETILQIPLLDDPARLTEEDIQRELDNNVQGILGYVVRWVHMGIGCSKVPDINNVGLMEDRATLRISSQHIANWLLHGLVSHSQVSESLKRMATLVDEQNASDAEYLPMNPDLANSVGFLAAQELIFQGIEQPNGYTEPVLHRMRQRLKAMVGKKSHLKTAING